MHPLLLLLLVSEPDPWPDTVQLAGAWRFTTGDDPAYAAPGYADADWASLPLPGTWDDTDHADHFGFAWYRRRVTVPTTDAPVVLVMHSIAYAAEVFADGVSIGQLGRPPPDPRGHWLGLRALPLPAEVLRDGEVTLAIRIYRDPVWFMRRSGMEPPMTNSFVIAPASLAPALVAHERLTRLRQPDILFHLIVAGIEWVFGLITLTMFLFDRRERSYLYYALTMLLGGVAPLTIVWQHVGAGDPETAFNVGWIVAAGLVLVFHGAFLAHLFSPPRWLRRLVMGPAFLHLAVSWLIPVFRGHLPLLLGFAGPLYLLFQLSLPTLTVWAVRRRRPDAWLLMSVAAVEAVLVFAWFGQAAFGVKDARWTVVSPLLGLLWAITMAVLLARRSRRDRAALQASQVASRRFVPLPFLERLGRTEVTEVARGDARALEMTVLFADIRGFTGLAERLGPSETFAFMNEYHALMEPRVLAEGGFINQYYGDGLMALFETPAAAVAAAQAMLSALDGFASGTEPVRIGIGVHMGEVMLGTIGGAKRLDTGVIGDAVNVAARLQALTVEQGTPLLLSGDVARAIGLTEGAKGEVTLRGREDPVTLFDGMRFGRTDGG